MIEIDKKQQAANSAPASLPSVPTASVVPSNPVPNIMLSSIPVPGTGKQPVKRSVSSADSASVHERMAELMRQISDEARRLATTRAELQKARKAITEAQGDNVKKTPQTEATTAAVETAMRGAQKMPVPDELLPELCRLLVHSGADGICKVVSRFQEVHPHISKRQLELKIAEISVKEKHESDTLKVWHIKPEYEHLLNDIKKEGSPPKRKQSSCDSSGPTPSKTSKLGEGDSANLTSPRSGKKRTAFSLFVKDKRSQVEADLGPDVDTAVLKKELLDMWKAIGAGGRAPYEQKEAELNARNGKAGSSEGGVKKKAKK